MNTQQTTSHSEYRTTVSGQASNARTGYKATVSYSFSLESAAVHLDKNTGRPERLLIVGLTPENYNQQVSHIGLFESGHAVPKLAQELVRKLVAKYFESPPVEFIREQYGAGWNKADVAVAA